MEGSVSILLGCVGITSDSRTVSFCFSFGHVARWGLFVTSPYFASVHPLLSVKLHQIGGVRQELW